jgi:thiol-disulfide isomerase/thioredoxin
MKREKIIILVLISLLCSSFSKAQSRNFELKGKINGISNGVVELIIEPVTDTSIIRLKKNRVFIKNGEFKFYGKSLYPYFCRIILNDSIFSKHFLIEIGENEMVFFKNSENNLTKQANSKNLLERGYNFQNLIKIEKIKIYKWAELYYNQQKLYGSNIPKNLADSMRNLRENMELKIDTLLYKYSKANTKSYWILWTLLENVQSNEFKPILYNTFLNLDISLRKTATGIKIKNLISAKRITSIGSIFPSLVLADTFNSLVKIDSNIFAKFTLIDFWFSHCGPCIMQFPMLNTLYKKFNRENFEIIGISIDNKLQKFDYLNAIKKNNLAWPQYWDVDNFQTKKMGITRFPFNILLNKKGEILAKDLDVEQIEDFLLKNAKN